MPQCHCALFPFISLGIASECDLGFGDLFLAVTGARLSVCCLLWQAVTERNGNRLQKSSQGGNWSFAQAQWAPAGMIWDGSYFGGCVCRRGCFKPSSRDPWLSGGEGVALCKVCSGFPHLWKVGSSFAWSLSLGLLSNGSWDSASKYTTYMCMLSSTI